MRSRDADTARLGAVFAPRLYTVQKIPAKPQLHVMRNRAPFGFLRGGGRRQYAYQPSFRGAKRGGISLPLRPQPQESSSYAGLRQAGSELTGLVFFFKKHALPSNRAQIAAMLPALRRPRHSQSPALPFQHPHENHPPRQPRPGPPKRSSLRYPAGRGLLRFR